MRGSRFSSRKFGWVAWNSRLIVSHQFIHTFPGSVTQPEIREKAAHWNKLRRKREMRRAAKWEVGVKSHRVFKMNLRWISAVSAVACVLKADISITHVIGRTRCIFVVYMFNNQHCLPRQREKGNVFNYLVMLDTTHPLPSWMTFTAKLLLSPPPLCFLGLCSAISTRVFYLIQVPVIPCWRCSIAPFFCLTGLCNRHFIVVPFSLERKL